MIEMISLMNQYKKYDTDKGTAFLDNYEHFFHPLKQNKIALLELGVLKGGSILMWGDYFKKGTIVGVDINRLEKKLPSNVHFELGDQRNKDFLNDISKKYTKDGFDIIIDDASHYANFTEATFLICFNSLLKAKGIYVIEDWGTGYWDNWPDGEKFYPSEDHISYKLRKNYEMNSDYEYPYKKSFCSHNIGMVGLVKQLIDELAIEDIKFSNKEMSMYETNIKNMFFASGQLFIFKK